MKINVQNDQIYYRYTRDVQYLKSHWYNLEAKVKHCDHNSHRENLISICDGNSQQSRRSEDAIVIKNT